MNGYWPDCAKPGCQFKSCRALSSIYCFHHTSGNQHVKRWKIDARHADSRDVVACATTKSSHGAADESLDPPKTGL